MQSEVGNRWDSIFKIQLKLVANLLDVLVLHNGNVFNYLLLKAYS